MKQLVAMLMVLVLMVMGCGKKDKDPISPPDDKIVPVSLKVVKTSSSVVMKKVTAQMVADAEVVGDTLDMGIVGRTKVFQFILVKNSKTDSAITDIVITSSNPKFTPARISIGTLGAPDVVSEFIPLINITAIHGYGENMLGLADLMGNDTSTTLTVSGMFMGEAFSIDYVLVVSPRYFTASLTDDPYMNKWDTLTIGEKSCPVTVKCINEGTADPVPFNVILDAGESIIVDYSVGVGDKFLSFDCVSDAVLANTRVESHTSDLIPVVCQP